MNCFFFDKNRSLWRKSVIFVRMKKVNPIYIRRVLLASLFVGVLAFRYIPDAGEAYARDVYPVVSFCLSAIAAIFPFSLCEIVVIVGSLFLILFPFYAKRKAKRSWKHIAFIEVEVILWVYVWFYWGWGMNYFRENIFERSQVSHARYDESRFKTFLVSYADSLNAAYCVPTDRDKNCRALESSIKNIYRAVPSVFGLSEAFGYQHPKLSLINGLYSKVGVLGYIGPFFCESHVNREVLPLQYPFTYAHELSHLLGVSEEAEANFWAYQTCIRSGNRFVRYSGYFGLLPYVYTNARATLSSEDFETWRASVRPEVLLALREKEEYWDERYSRLMGTVQNVLYEWYLKGNRISSGQKNYGEVIGIILSMPQGWWNYAERR